MMSKALQRKNYTKYYICTSYGVYGTYISYGTYNSVVSSLYTVYNKTIMQNEYMLSSVSSVDLNYHEKYIYFWEINAPNPHTSQIKYFVTSLSTRLKLDITSQFPSDPLRSNKRQKYNVVTKLLGGLKAVLGFALGQRIFCQQLNGQTAKTINSLKGNECCSSDWFFASD